MLEICEVAPRDGLQSLGVVIAADQRVQFIKNLFSIGLKKQEIGALVNPKWVPEMANSDTVFNLLKEQFTPSEISNFALLVPNQRGLDRALELECKYLAFFTATSETFNQKNINTSVKESIHQIETMLKQVANLEIQTRLYISTVFHCPYEGFMRLDKALIEFEPLFDLVDEISLGDTTGYATPTLVKQLGVELTKQKYHEKIWWHFHDTLNKAVENASVAIDLGYRKFDSSAGGIGGCPFAPGARGNIATQDLIQLAKEKGLRVDVNIDLLNGYSNLNQYKKTLLP